MDRTEPDQNKERRANTSQNEKHQYYGAKKHLFIL